MTRGHTTLRVLAVGGALAAGSVRVAGASSGPSQAISPDVPEHVRAALSVGSETALPLSGPMLQGRAAVRHRGFTMHGIPVRRAYATVVGDQVVAESLPRELPELLPGQARLDGGEAAVLAHAHALQITGVAVPVPDEPGELVYLTILGVPVLAYQVEMPLTLAGEEPSRRTIWISANSGIVLDEWEHVRSSRALVFKNNPAVTPIPIEVTFSGIHTEEAGQPLVGERIISYGCAVEDPGVDVPEWWEEGKCWPVQRARSDSNGDFFVKIPDILKQADNRDGNDEYAEVSMYHHAERFVDQMKVEGVDRFKCDVSTMLANYRTPKLSPSYPDLPYTPLNNAYWTNTCEPDKGATMIFGQGSEVDFGYDGEVVYHELGHGMVSLLTPDGLGSRTQRPDGLLADAGGLNEAVADYFSVMLANDPELGDYVARFWPGYGASIRSAENKKRCPEDIIGEVHADGEPWMAAMWATRKRVGQAKVDPLVIEMLTRLPADADLETASWTIYDIAMEQFAAGVWTDSDLEFLVRAFDERGLYDCERVIVDPMRVSSGRSMYLRQKGTAVTPFFPGPMQLRHQVPADTDNIIVKFRLTPGGGPPDNPSGVVVLLKRADAPIEFTYTLTALDKVNGGGTKPSVREVIDVDGDWDLKLQASTLGTSDNQLVIRGFRPGEVVHVALANLTTAEQVPGGVAIVSVPPEFLDDGTVHVDVDLDEAMDSETETDGYVSSGGWTDPEVEESAASASCACDGRGDAGGLIGMLGTIGMLPLLRRRRR